MSKLKFLMGVIFFILVLFGPLFFQEELDGINFKGLYLANAGMNGTLTALCGAVFFFMLCWFMDEPRWRYVLLSTLVLSFLLWATLWVVLLIAMYLFFGTGVAISGAVSSYNEQANQKIPVTSLSPEQYTQQVNDQLSRCWDDNYARTSRLGYYQTPVPVGHPSNKKEDESVPVYHPMSSLKKKEVSYTDHNGSVTVTSSKKPIRGIRWFYEDPETGRANSIGRGRKLKTQWDDIGQLRADKKPTPDNENGIYMFGLIDGFHHPLFHAYASPGMFAAEVEEWGTVIHHPHEDVYRGENGKIVKKLFTYEEWIGGIKQQNPTNQSPNHHY